MNFVHYFTSLLFLFLFLSVDKVNDADVSNAFCLPFGVPNPLVSHLYLLQPEVTNIQAIEKIAFDLSKVSFETVASSTNTAHHVFPNW